MKPGVRVVVAEQSSDHAIASHRHARGIVCCGCFVLRGPDVVYEEKAIQSSSNAANRVASGSDIRRRDA